ncbi:hypothetical protein GGTG_01472 [Gaeumannomyces tritici R3-111a-1]|uniref:GPI anchored serine-rich protein n=1 Tax=Gaeumannomyces tritici (strain R3-111a-1) TaxID=644352 RepID=J3NJP2_GAET3|nr:hypothetical protein GGTG_01472 [Gaeumannomyces tritici R3-111a-1]EJT81494.1 hypothetical protein GGTG_01472 [Gaeumannomyces tritici R3-111a-1]
MLASNVVYGIVASFAALAAAQTTSGTTTSTATMTRTITITTCNPEVSNCPGRTSSTSSSSSISTAVNTTTSSVMSTSSTYYPTANLTSAFPVPSKNATSYMPHAPTKIVTTGGTSLPPAPTLTPPVTLPVGSGGSAVFFQSGLMLGLLGAGVAILA